MREQWLHNLLVLITMRAWLITLRAMTLGSIKQIFTQMTTLKKLVRDIKLAIPIRAEWCSWLPVQNEVRLLATNALMVRNNTFPLRALRSYLDPSLRTFVCPFLMQRMRNSFSVDLRTERKWVPYNARQEPKWPKRVILANCANGDGKKMRKWVSQCAENRVRI